MNEMIRPLADYRKANGLTQKEAAEKIPVARETWARWEAGTRDIDRELLPKVSEVTGIPKSQLLPPELRDEPPPLAPAEAPQ